MNIIVIIIIIAIINNIIKSALKAKKVNIPEEQPNNISFDEEEKFDVSRREGIGYIKINNHKENDFLPEDKIEQALKSSKPLKKEILSTSKININKKISKERLIDGIILSEILAPAKGKEYFFSKRRD